jgi:hypothetical protein
LASGIVGAVELASFLLEFLWSDFYLGSVFKKFWDDVAVAQAMKTCDLNEGYS